MIYVLSGGSGITHAVIAVTYPSGSICTCGGQAAKDTSGYALFPVKAGTYIVECHTSDNSKSKSTSVTVTARDKGKAKSVTLQYSLVLFDNGTDNTAVTGGWTPAPVNGRVQVQASVNNISGTGEQSDTETTTSVNSIDLSKYTKLKFYGVVSTYKVTLGVDGATVNQAATTGTDVLVDISNVNSVAKKIKLTITAYSNSGPVTETASVAKIELLP